MNPLNPIFAILIFFIAYATSFLINRKHKLTNGNVRFETIDGLRGFLAIGVFIHHSTIWFQFLQIRSWELPKSNLYSQLGQTSVAFFFMITSFLFVTKILNSDKKKIDWSNLFVSRFFRLVPMYIFSIGAVVLIIFISSNWKLNVTHGGLLRELLYWTTFTIAGCPTINGFSYTNLVNAGVVWSLPYEWLFYISLPVLSFFILRKFNSMGYLLLSILGIYVFLKLKEIEMHHLMSFAGGAIAPFIIKYGKKKIRFTGPVFSIIIVICLGLILKFPTSNDYVCKLLIIVVFNLVALGNTLFGILRNSTLKLLGEISYSTYLIHGTIIYVVMNFVFREAVAVNLSSTQFCIIVFAITPLVVYTSFLTYKNIEKPFMNLSRGIQFKVKTSFNWRLAENAARA